LPGGCYVSYAPTQVRRLRCVAKWILIHALRWTGLLGLAKWWIRRNGAVVLTFHRVLSEEALAQTSSQSGLLIGRTTFEQLLRYIKDHYSVFDLARGGLQDQREHIQVAITFDDGWEDNASTAFPTAAKWKLPFTIFICPQLMEKSAPFWPEHVVALVRSASASAAVMAQICRILASAGHPEWAASLTDSKGDCTDALIEWLKTLPVKHRENLLDSILSRGLPPEAYPNGSVDCTMSWSQAELLHQAGISFGSHTQRHEILTRIPLAQVEQEVSESKTAIEDHLAHCSLFSYPNGNASPEVRDVVARCGFKLAFINSAGVWRRSSDPLLIPRINVSEGDLTSMDGRFSPLAFEYRVFWKAFIHRGRGSPGQRRSRLWTRSAAAEPILAEGTTVASPEQQLGRGAAEP